MPSKKGNQIIFIGLLVISTILLSIFNNSQIVMGIVVLLFFVFIQFLFYQIGKVQEIMLQELDINHEGESLEDCIFGSKADIARAKKDIGNVVEDALNALSGTDPSKFTNYRNYSIEKDGKVCYLLSTILEGIYNNLSKKQLAYLLLTNIKKEITIFKFLTSMGIPKEITFSILKESEERQNPEVVDYIRKARKALLPLNPDDDFLGMNLEDILNL